MIEPARPHPSVAGTRPWTPGAVVKGRVGAALANGAVALLTPLGSLAVHGLPALPPGTVVTLRLPERASEPVSLMNARAPASPAGTNVQAAASLETFEAPQLMRSWPALQAARDRVPEAAARAIAGPNSALPARVLEAQGARATPTPNIAALIAALSERGDAALASRVASDWNALAAIAREAAPEDWTLSVLPFLSAGALQQMRVFVHRGEDDRPGNAVRFAIELDESPYGALRLEGLARAERLDLCLSTSSPVPEAAADDLRVLVRRTLTHLGQDGALSIPAPAPVRTMARPHAGQGLLA